jgi:hypothetical protein
MRFGRDVQLASDSGGKRSLFEASQVSKNLKNSLIDDERRLKKFSVLMECALDQKVQLL